MRSEDLVSERLIDHLMNTFVVLRQTSTQRSGTHCGKTTDGARLQVLGSLKEEDRTSDDEKELLLKYFFHALVPGAPGYRAARILVRKREAALDDDVLK